MKSISAPTPSWGPAAVGRVPTVICLREPTNSSSYANKTKAGQGSGVARTRRKNDANLIVGPMALTTIKPDAIQAQ